MDYFIGIRGVQSGPFSEAEIREKIANNAYPPGTLCWTDGWPQWRSLESAFPRGEATPPPMPGNYASAQPGRYNSFRPDHMQPGETSGLAIASLVLGVAGFVTFFSAIPAIICGHVACSEIKKSEGRKTGRGLAITGLIMGYFMIALFPVVIAAVSIPAFQKVRSTAQEKAVLNNLRQLNAAADQFMLEKDVARATYADLVGSSSEHYIRTLPPVAGENYTDLVINKEDRQIKVTLSDGRVVVLERFYADDNATFAR